MSTLRSLLSYMSLRHRFESLDAETTSVPQSSLQLKRTQPDQQKSNLQTSTPPGHTMAQKIFWAF